MEYYEVLDVYEVNIQELFGDERSELGELRIEMTATGVTEKKWEKAMRCMKEEKAMGEDGVSIEMLQIVYICRKIERIEKKNIQKWEVERGYVSINFSNLPHNL